MMLNIISSSIEISIMPMLMPAFRGTLKARYGLPPSAAHAPREFASVFTRMPNHATK